MASPSTKSSPASPDCVGKNWLSVSDAGRLSETLAPVTVKVFVLESKLREPVEKSMPASGALSVTPVGRVAEEFRRLWAKSTPIPVLTSAVPTGGAAESQPLGFVGLRLWFFVMV